MLVWGSCRQFLFSNLDAMYVRAARRSANIPWQNIKFPFAQIKKKIKPSNHRSLTFFATFSSLRSNGAKMSHYKPRASQIN